MYVGLDVHKRYSYYAMVDGRGTVVKKDRFRTTVEELGDLANALPDESQVAIEASASGQRTKRVKYRLFLMILHAVVL